MVHTNPARLPMPVQMQMQQTPFYSQLCLPFHPMGINQLLFIASNSYQKKIGWEIALMQIIQKDRYRAMDRMVPGNCILEEQPLVLFVVVGHAEDNDSSEAGAE
jgi:hypothetical protein